MSLQNTLRCKSPEKPVLGVSNVTSDVPEQLRVIMRENSEALKDLTNKSRGSRLTKRKRG